MILSFFFFILEILDDLKLIYAAFHDLANYFEMSEDVWLSDYFFKKCLAIVTNGKTNWEIRKEAESHCNLGLSYEKQSLISFINFNLI